MKGTGLVSRGMNFVGSVSLLRFVFWLTTERELGHGLSPNLSEVDSLGGFGTVDIFLAFLEA